MLAFGRQVSAGGKGIALVAALLAAAAACGWSLPTDRSVWPAWVKAQVVNVRDGPGTDADKIGQLPLGTKIQVTAFNNQWCKAKLPDGEWGWVAEWLLEFSWDKGRELAAQAQGSTATSSDSSPPAWIKISAANVRTGPGLGYKSYGTLPKGTKVYKLRQRNDWVELKTPGGSGWVRTDLLEFNLEAGRKLALSASAAQAPSAKAYVNGNNVRLRAGPGTNRRIIATLKKGQTVYLYESRGDWKKVNVHGGRSGWIAGHLLILEGQQRSESAPPPSGPADFPSPTIEKSNSSPDGELYAWIDEERVNVRSGPGQDEEMSFQLTRGQKVQVEDVSEHWCEIKTADGRSGWIAGWVIDFSPPGVEFMAQEGDQSVEVKVGWVARPVVKLRSGAGQNHPEIADLALSTQVIIIGQEGQWYEVALDNGKTGWVASWLIDTRAQRLARRATGPGEPGETELGGSGAAIVKTAMQYLGYPYVSGASGPDAFDCSGLVHYVMRRHSIRVGRTCPDLFRQGQPVSRSQLSPGDAVFFVNTYRRGLSHVGIYVGGEKFIHASHPGDTVKITSLGSPYYASRYRGARRMY